MQKFEEFRTLFALQPTLIVSLALGGREKLLQSA
jgi:hypothetical protein